MNITGNRIELIRTKRGVSQKELAIQVGISGASLSAIERGLSKPRPKNSKAICDALGVEFEELFTIAERGRCDRE